MSCDVADQFRTAVVPEKPVDEVKFVEFLNKLGVPVRDTVFKLGNSCYRIHEDGVSEVGPRYPKLQPFEHFMETTRIYLENEMGRKLEP